MFVNPITIAVADMQSSCRLDIMKYTMRYTRITRAYPIHAAVLTCI